MCDGLFGEKVKPQHWHLVMPGDEGVGDVRGDAPLVACAEGIWGSMEGEDSKIRSDSAFFNSSATLSNVLGSVPVAFLYSFQEFHAGPYRLFSNRSRRS